MGSSKSPLVGNLPDSVRRAKLQALGVPPGVLAAYDAARNANERVAGLVAWCRTLRPAEKTTGR